MTEDRNLDCRLNLRVHRQVKDTIEDLKEIMDCDTLSETVRRAISIATPIAQAQRDGKIVIIKDPETGEEREFRFY